MNNNWKRLCAIGLVSVLVVTMLMSVSLVGVIAPKPPKPPPTPADPAIAFYTQTSGPNPNRIMVMNADGSNQAIVYEEYFSLFGNPTWSPDGKSLAWCGQKYTPNVPGSGEYGLWRIDVNVVDGKPQGSNLQKLVTSATDHLTSAAWSPLGDEIAFGVWINPPGGRTMETQDEIRVVPANRGPTEPIFIAAGPYMLTSPTWSSDGTKIAFIGGGDTRIRIVERATKTTLHLFDMSAYSPLAYLDWARQGSNVLIFHDGVRTINTFDIDSGVVTPVVEGCCASWSPDNSKIVYQQLGRSITIGIYEFSTGNIVSLTKGQQPDWRRF